MLKIQNDLCGQVPPYLCTSNRSMTELVPESYPLLLSKPALAIVFCSSADPGVCGDRLTHTGRHTGALICAALANRLSWLCRCRIPGRVVSSSKFLFVLQMLVVFAISNHYCRDLRRKTVRLITIPSRIEKATKPLETVIIIIESR